MLIKEYGKAKSHLVHIVGLEPRHGADPAKNGEYRFLKLLDCLDIPAKGTQLEFPINNAERTRANKIGEEAGLSAKSCVSPHAFDMPAGTPCEEICVCRTRSTYTA